TLRFLRSKPGRQHEANPPMRVANRRSAGPSVLPLSRSEHSPPSWNTSSLCRSCDDSLQEKENSPPNVRLIGIGVALAEEVRRKGCQKPVAVLGTAALLALPAGL